MLVDLSAIDVIFLNVQNICNLIGQEECNIGRVVHLFSILYFRQNKQQDSVFSEKSRNLSIKIKFIIINY